MERLNLKVCEKAYKYLYTNNILKIYFEKLKHDIGKEKKNYFLKGKNTLLTKLTIIILEGINFITTEYNQMRIGKKDNITKITHALT